MKILLILLALFMMSGQAIGATCEQLTAKFIEAAQKKDYKMLLEKKPIYQSRVKQIQKEVPRYDQERQINEAFEYEKKQIPYMNLFSMPNMKWQIIETNINKKYQVCTTHVRATYNSLEESPEFYDFRDPTARKRIKSVVMPFKFDIKTGYFFEGLEYDSNSIQSW